MSTWIYLICHDHSEPIQAEEESGQHLYDLPQLRFDWLNRAHWLAYIDRFPGALTREWDYLTYFQRNTFSFLREHAECGIPRVVSEYGDRFRLDANTLSDLFDEAPESQATP